MHPRFCNFFQYPACVGDYLKHWVVCGIAVQLDRLFHRILEWKHCQWNYECELHKGLWRGLYTDLPY